MKDYAKMYAVLCGAIDDVIDGLEALPGAAEYAQHLKPLCSRRRKSIAAGKMLPRRGS